MAKHSLWHDDARPSGTTSLSLDHYYPALILDQRRRLTALRKHFDSDATFGAFSTKIQAQEIVIFSPVAVPLQGPDMFLGFRLDDGAVAICYSNSTYGKRTRDEAAALSAEIRQGSGMETLILYAESPLSLRRVWSC